MAENSAIEWTTHTFNPWRGCTKVSAGCANCYAETLSKRNPAVLGTWGDKGTRIVAAAANWAEVLKWSSAAIAEQNEWRPGDLPQPERPRVFCASLADVFEDWKGPMHAPGKAEVILGRDYRASFGQNRLTMHDVRTRLFELIDETPALDWLLLTKRPENVLRMLDEISNGNGYAWNLEDHMKNVWLGTTVENRAAFERIDVLRSIPAAVRFLSVEPMLEDLGTLDLTGIHWVIVGGESGHGSRPFQLNWAREIVKQCRAAGVAVFVKQFGAQPIEHVVDCTGGRSKPQPLKLIDRRKGGDIAEWPRELQIREFPKAVLA